LSTDLNADASAGGTPDATTTSTIALPYRVYVSGAVVVPGVVRVGEDARVLDALDLAKGAAPDANLDVLNLAAVIHDGDHVHVPRLGDPAGVGGVTSAASSAANSPASVTQAPSKVSLNTASATELETLDGVGPATAQTIIKYRTENGPFSSIDELLNVSGIGPAKLERMRDGLVL
jgi:competence protein ComEA